ncbi:glutamate-1-semialdehyde 2,1-aminomutase [Bradyrhizobium diazoefficiens]
METTLPILSMSVAAAASAAAAFPKLKARIELSRAKHRSLAGHSKMSRRVARLLPFYEFGENDYFSCDGAPANIAAQRKDGFFRLASLYAERYPKGRAMTKEAAEKISDLNFTESYRVPFQFSRLVREHLGTSTFMESSRGVTVTDVDGNTSYDLTGSYGVNIFGNDFYKECIEGSEKRAHALGPVLGPYHPVILENVARLCQISGLDEVSFHMSGTEAVMQAVRLARYHTRRTHLVRFAGAYHGWWGDVQPGVGNPLPAHETYTLAEMSEKTLHVLRTRKDIACVLVNPLQGLHPNANAPGDSSLVDSSRGGNFDRAAYTEWLKKLREVCTERGIVLIFDEVFVGFRLAAGGAQEYFGVRADMVTYGKSLAGGLPVGVVCGKRELMRRFRDDRPADICFARGTFNSHPYVMTAMDELFEPARQPELPRHLRRPGRDLERPRGKAQPDDGGRRPAGAVRQLLVDLDGEIHHAVPLQLDAAILFARRRPGAELGRHRPADLQPELHRRRLHRGRRTLHPCGREDEGRRLLVARRRAHQQEHQAADFERDAGQAFWALRLFAAPRTPPYPPPLPACGERVGVRGTHRERGESWRAIG